MVRLVLTPKKDATDLKNMKKPMKPKKKNYKKKKMNASPLVKMLTNEATISKITPTENVEQETKALARKLITILADNFLLLTVLKPLIS